MFPATNGPRRFLPPSSSFQPLLSAGRWSSAVSYTPLAVYTRQVLDCTQIDPEAEAAARAAAEADPDFSLDPFDPVDLG